MNWGTTVSAAADEMGGIPETWNWKATPGLMLPISWIAVYGYIITFTGGEVKSPRTNIFQAQILNAAICIASLLWVGLAYQRMAGWEGIHALAWIDEEIFHIYSNPFYDELVARGVTFPFIKEVVAKSLNSSTLN